MIYNLVLIVRDPIYFVAMHLPAGFSHLHQVWKSPHRCLFTSSFSLEYV